MCTKIYCNVVVVRLSFSSTNAYGAYRLEHKNRMLIAFI